MRKNENIQNMEKIMNFDQSLGLGLATPVLDQKFSQTIYQ